MELKGKIVEMIDDSSGYIKSMNDYYYFDRSDLIDNFKLRENIDVVFKPIIINGIKKAILIEQINV